LEDSKRQSISLPFGTTKEVVKFQPSLHCLQTDGATGSRNAIFHMVLTQIIPGAKWCDISSVMPIASNCIQISPELCTHTRPQRNRLEPSQLLVLSRALFPLCFLLAAREQANCFGKLGRGFSPLPSCLLPKTERPTTRAKNNEHPPVMIPGILLPVCCSSCVCLFAKLAARAASWLSLFWLYLWANK